MASELSLYKIEDHLSALLDTLEGASEEDQETQLAILNEIAEMSQAAVAKRDNVIRFLRHLKLQQEAIDTELERLSKLKHSYARGQARVEAYVISVIEQLPEPKRGPRKLEGKIGVLLLRKKPDHVEITDEMILPFKYKDVNLRVSGDVFTDILDAGLVRKDEARYSYQPRKSDIKKAIDAGEEVTGADVKFGQNYLEIR